MLIATVCALILALYAFRHRKLSSVSIPFGFLMVAIGVWAFGAALEAAVGNFSYKIISAKIQYPGIVGVPLLWFLVAMEYSHAVKWITRRRIVILWIMPGITALAAVTNEFHYLLWSDIFPGPAVSAMISNGPIPVYGHGILFWVYFVYSYILLLIATCFMIRTALRSRDLYRFQAAAMVTGVALPWIGNMVYILGLSPVQGLDLTPIAFLFSGMAVAWAVLRYRLLDIVPVACDVLIKNMADPVMVIDARNRIAEVNPAGCSLLGTVVESAMVGETLENVLSFRPWLRLTLPADMDAVSQSVVRTDMDAHGTYDMRVTPLRDSHGRLVGRLIVLHDITKQKQIEEEIRALNLTLEDRVKQRTDMLEREIAEHRQAREDLLKSEEKYRVLVEDINDIIFTADTLGYFTYINPVFEQIAGYHPDEVIGRHFTDFAHPEELVPLGSVFTRVMSGKNVLYELRAIDKKGNILHLRASCRPINEEGRIVGLVGTMIDITERRKAEEERRRLELQLQHTQKLESLGVLAGGIAHDFNNILTGILGNADLALMKLTPESPVWMNIKDILQGSYNASELCRQMLAYSGKGRFELRPIDIRESVREIVHLLEASISKNAALRIEFPDHLPAIYGDAVQVRQVIMNLVMNASEAIGEEPGAIILSAGTEHCTRGFLAATYLDDNLAEGDYVFLEVSDTGCGMDEATRTRMFEPFFTTKFTGRGLGLAAVLGIVRGHRGAIKISSEPGKGSVFRVVFPVSDLAHAPAGVRQDREGHWRGNGTLLLVDDEDSVLSVGRRMLEELGFRVLTASNGREAVNMFAEEKGSIQCVILDLTMPQMNGVETFRELKRIMPDACVVISSGYSENEISERFTGHRISGYVQKPYRLKDLAAILKELV